jgi:hypothetical protein
VLRQSKVIKPEQTLNAVISRKEAVILTDRKATETDEDCKIDAVLIAKEIINSFPDQISRVRITFQKSGNGQASQVDVTAGDVKAFAMGAIKPEALLGSLELVQVDYAAGAGQGMTVAAGPLMDKRLMLLSRIEALKAKGTSVKPFLDLFDNIEGETKQQASEEKISGDIAYLAEKLTDQENLVKEARAAGTVHRQASGPISPTEFKRKCDAMQAKFDRWQQQGLNVSQLNYSLALIRQMGADADSSKRMMAAAAIESMEHTGEAALNHH